MSKEKLFTRLHSMLSDDRDYQMATSMFNLMSFDNILFVCMVGSHAHGTNTDKSDIDIKVVYKLPMERFSSIYREYDGIEIFREHKDYQQKTGGGVFALTKALELFLTNI